MAAGRLSARIAGAHAIVSGPAIGYPYGSKKARWGGVAIEAPDFKSPLEDVAGHPVLMSELLELAALAPLDDEPLLVLSTHLRKILVRTARNVRKGKTAEKHIPLRLADLIFEMARLRNSPPYDTFEAFYGAFNGPEVPDPLPGKKIDIEAGFRPATFTNVIADGELTTVLAKGAQLAAQLRERKQSVIGLRHFTLALLTEPKGLEALWWAGLVEGTPQTVRSTLVGGFEAALERYKFFGENRSDWHEILVEARNREFDLHLPVPIRVSEDSYVPDRPVERLSEDQLGFANEVRALARVIALKEPGPPLAVGLFGDWGSGKSSFMKMLEDAIDQTTEAAARDKTSDNLFVKKVAHIPFNAWVYNDTDLWSSITSHVFRELRGKQGEGSDDPLRGILDQLSKLVAVATKEAEKTATSVQKKQKDRDGLQLQLNGIEDTAVQKRIELLGEATAGALRKLDGKDQLKSVLVALGSDPKDFEGEKAEENARKRLERDIENAAGFTGHVATLGMALIRALTFAGPGTPWLWGSIAVALTIILLVPSDTALFPDLWTTVLKSAVTLGAIGVPLIRFYKVVEPVLRAGRQFKAEYEDAKAKADKEVAEKRKAIDELDADISALLSEQKRAKNKAERYREAGPDEVFDFFLNEAEQSRSFDDNLGIVSKVRSVFEELDRVIKNKREDGSAPLDRIVLYIDDLDRCRARTVVNVLEAVHLLLALDLFVVVVGVDPRWLSQALEKELDLKPWRGQQKPTATPKDYLEKIFQIPVRLGRLETTADAFKGYVDSISGPRADDNIKDSNGSAHQPDGNGHRLRIAAADVELPPLKREAQENVEAVLLREHELTLTKNLGALVGRSPRAVKKFVNLYRLLRGMRQGADLEAFLQQKGPAEVNYAAVQFWLAADCGLSSAQMDALRDVVRTASDDAKLSEIFAKRPPAAQDTDDERAKAFAADQKARPHMHQFWENSTDDQRQHLPSAFAAISQELGTANAVKQLRAALAETRRFSASL